MDKQPILSICIPTNGIVEWIIPVVESIYAQEVDNGLFEVVITDNGGKDDLEKALRAFDYPNLHYYKTSSQGFTNQVDAFEKCSGLFCKMLNHRSKMLPGSIEKLIALVERYKVDKPIIYCAEGNVKGDDIIECKNMDEFVCRMSYLASWSAGTGAWKSDLIDLREKSINTMYPHTVFLFYLRENSKYVIWNGKYEVMGRDVGKGGYDVFRTFGVTFLDILTDLRVHNRISLETFVLVKKELLRYLRGLYQNEVILPTYHTFVTKNIHQSINVYYGTFDYFRMVLGAWLDIPYLIIKIFLMKVMRLFKDKCK